jgi:periplasmic protein TonB
MTSNEILKADVLDIVFDNRNKNYGAYVLRKYYNNRLLIAMSGMIGVVLILVLIIVLNPQARKAVTRVFNGGIVTIEPLPEIPIEEPKPIETPKPNIKSQKFVNNFQIVSNDIPTDVPDQTDLSTSMIGTEKNDGEDFTGGQQPPRNNNTDVAPEIKEPEPTPPAPSSAAAFPGGPEKWMQFLNRNLNTPSELEAGQRKNVVVRFTVSEDGSVTQFEIIQSGGEAFDREVLRVLKKMPKWKPAIQNGRPVSVLFTQPVTFMAVEE